MVEAASRDRLGIAVITLLLFAALIVVVFRFYPMVRFGPETIRWRNRFRFKVVPTGSVRRLGVENFNSKAWVPVVVAYLDRGGFRRQSARFVATFSYRRDVAQVIAKEVLAWASEHAIPADLPPDLMVWRIKQPETVGSTNY
jgi:hypothetical protein